MSALHSHQQIFKISYWTLIPNRSQIDPKGSKRVKTILWLFQNRGVPLEYRISTLSPVGYGAQGILTAIQEHFKDVVKLDIGISRTKGHPQPPWHLQTKIAQEERTNFSLYLEITLKYFILRTIPSP